MAARKASDPKPATRTAPQASFPLLVRPLILALGAVVFIFVVYDFVEITWLSDVDYERRETFHQLRGVFSALTAATLVGWLILRRSHTLLAPAFSSDDWDSGSRPSTQERHTAYARWFVRMRWIAVMVAAILIVLTVLLAELLPLSVLWPLGGAVVLLAVLNAAYTVLIRKGIGVSRLLSFQAYADLVILVVLLHFSGGIENPLSPLMLFHVIIAGIVLSRRECFIVATVAAVLFAGLAWVELMSLVPHYTLAIFPHFENEGYVFHAAHSPLFVASTVVLQGAILMLSAFFVTTLSDRLRQDEGQLQRFADRILRERQLLERALETTGTALCVCDAELQPLWHNRQWDIWFGGGDPDSSVREQIHGDDSPARLTIRDGHIHVAEFDSAVQGACSCDQKNRRTFQTTAAPLTNPDGEIAQVVQLIHDVTEQKQTQARMLRAGQLAAVGELAGQVAHEVNNPTAIISAKARLLLANHRSEMSDKTAEELTKITEMADRVARIAQGLLSYCRPSTGTRARIDVRVPIRKALSMIEERARLAGVRIDDHFMDRPSPVMANAGEIEQVFLNLCLNSLDSMPTGGCLTLATPAPELREGDRMEVSVVVEDTGIGIPEELRGRIFEPFFTTKSDGNGTGLGLSICVGLVRSHGGSIDVVSEFGKGTRMVVRLPLAEADIEDTQGMPLKEFLN